MEYPQKVIKLIREERRKLFASWHLRTNFLYMKKLHGFPSPVSGANAASRFLESMNKFDEEYCYSPSDLECADDKLVYRLLLHLDT